MSHFPLVDRYFSTLLGSELSALSSSGPSVVETELRLRRAQSYGFVHALWWLWLEDGRSLASVPPGAGQAVAAIVGGTTRPEASSALDLAPRLRATIDPLLAEAGLAAIDRTGVSLVFACNYEHLRIWRTGDCRRLRDVSIPPAEGLYLPEHCFPDGTVYGVVEDERVVAVAYAHRSGIMEGMVADMGVDTAVGYRRRGYAKTAVSAVVREVVARGGEAVYDCRPDNVASASTARSVGFVPYGGCLVLGAPDEPLARPKVVALQRRRDTETGEESNG